MSTFYISTGEKNMMYTLREQWKEKVTTAHGAVVEVIRDMYHRNLSTDAKTAQKVAMVLGYFVGKPEFDLKEIERSKERMKQADLEAIIAEREAARIASIKQAELEKLNRIADGKWPFGYDTGKPIEDVIASRGFGYALWWTRMEEKDVVVEELCRYFEANFENVRNVLNAPKPRYYYMGEEKEKFKDVPVTYVKSTSFDGYYGTTYIESYITDDGYMLVYMGGAPKRLELGSKVKLNFTVKGNDIYNNVYQTLIKNIKVVEAK